MDWGHKMKADKNRRKVGFLTDLTILVRLLIPFFLAFFPSYQLAFADEDPNLFSSSFSNRQTNSAVEASDRSERIKLLVDYVRKEGPGWMPGLPSFLRDPGGWALGNLKSVQHELSLGLGFSFGIDAKGINDDGVMTSVIQPVAALMQPPPETQSQAFWLSPNYHHKGFLPVNDALIMGMNVRHRVWGNRMQLDLHPYLGQNWHNSDNYWGTELSLGLRESSTGQEWGKIAMRYNNGNSAVMDNGRGFDLHADMKFNEQLSLTAGVQKNPDSSNSNYALLRWKLATFGP